LGFGGDTCVYRYVRRQLVGFEWKAGRLVFDCGLSFGKGKNFDVCQPSVGRFGAAVSAACCACWFVGWFGAWCECVVDLDGCGVGGCVSEFGEADAELWVVAVVAGGWVAVHLEFGAFRGGESVRVGVEGDLAGVCG